MRRGGRCSARRRRRGPSGLAGPSRIASWATGAGGADRCLREIRVDDGFSSGGGSLVAGHSGLPIQVWLSSGPAPGGFRGGAAVKLAGAGGAVESWPGGGLRKGVIRPFSLPAGRGVSGAETRAQGSRRLQGGVRRAGSTSPAGIGASRPAQAGQAAVIVGAVRGIGPSCGRCRRGSARGSAAPPAQATTPASTRAGWSPVPRRPGSALPGRLRPVRPRSSSARSGASAQAAAVAGADRRFEAAGSSRGPGASARNRGRCRRGSARGSAAPPAQATTPASTRAGWSPVPRRPGSALPGRLRPVRPRSSSARSGASPQLRPLPARIGASKRRDRRRGPGASARIAAGDRSVGRAALYPGPGETAFEVSGFDGCLGGAGGGSDGG